MRDVVFGPVVKIKSSQLHFFDGAFEKVLCKHAPRGTLCAVAARIDLAPEFVAERLVCRALNCRGLIALFVRISHVAEHTRRRGRLANVDR